MTGSAEGFSIVDPFVILEPLAIGALIAIGIFSVAVVVAITRRR